MGRGEGKATSSPTRRGWPHQQKIREWIRTIDPDGQPLEKLSDAPSVLMQEYGPPAAHIDPLVDLPEGIESADPGKQLDSLVRKYSLDVLQGWALILYLTQTAEGDGEKRIQREGKLRLERVMRELESDDPEEITEHLLRSYQSREAQLHWACYRLGWPSDWVLGTLRNTLRERYEKMGPLPERVLALPESDPEMELDMEETFGEAPEDLNPLSTLPEGIESESLQEQLLALEREFSDLARELVACEELAENAQTDLANDLRLRLRAESSRAGDEDESAALWRYLQMRRAEEAQLYWAAKALDISPSSVLLYLKERVER